MLFQEHCRGRAGNQNTLQVFVTVHAMVVLVQLIGFSVVATLSSELCQSNLKHLGKSEETSYCMNIAKQYRDCTVSLINMGTIPAEPLQNWLASLHIKTYGFLDQKLQAISCTRLADKETSRTSQ